MQGVLLDSKNERGGFPFLLVLALIFVLFTLIFNNVFVLVKVSGDSMNETLSSGDVLLVNKLKDVSRGDVVVVNHPSRGMVIKRVIAVGGDEIRCDALDDGDGKIYIKYKGTDEFVALDEPYLSVTNPDIYQQKVEEGCLFILGDNRSNSTDSSSYGAIKSEYVVGVVSQKVIDNKGVITKALGWTFKLVEFFGCEE